MRVPNASETCFTDLSNWDWDADLARCAQDRGAVRRYFEALDKGFLGEAIRERYAFDGQVGPDGIVEDTEMTVDELVVSDLQELLDDDDDRLDNTRDFLSRGLVNTDDPGIELVRTMVGMIDGDPPAARRRRALRTELIGFLEENRLDVSKVDRVLDIMLEESWR